MRTSFLEVAHSVLDEGLGVGKGRLELGGR